jgi:hypothetical protein
MTPIRSSALALEEDTPVPACVAPEVAPDSAPKVATTLAPKEAQYVVAEHLTCCSAVLVWPKGLALLQMGMSEPSPFIKWVKPFRVYAGTPSNRRTGELCRLWSDEEDSPVDLPSAKYHAWAFLNCLQAEPTLAGRLVPASDLKKQYSRFCHAMRLPERAWQTVVAHLNRLTGGKRVYRRLNGPNIRVYRIPERQRRGKRGLRAKH